MLNESQPVTAQGASLGTITPEAFFLIAEMTHRVVNEYSVAISSLSLAATRAPDPQAREDILRATARLRDFASAHRALQIPVVREPIDLLEYLGEICRTMSRATLDERGISLTLTGDSVALEASRCWRLGLIVAELITNAARHGLARRTGAIMISIRSTRSAVFCEIIDNGNAASSPRPGRGSAIIAALIAQLGGWIDRRFTDKGTIVALSVPNT